jgi:hypothetical protein
VRNNYQRKEHKSKHKFEVVQGQEVPDDRVRLHRGKAPLGDDGGVDEEGAEEARGCDTGSTPRQRQVN